MEQCLREGLPFPEKIANAPELIAGLELYYLGFIELSDSRQIGMAIGPISWQTVRDYCQSISLCEEQTEAMHHHIKEMDGVFLEYNRRKK
jgi:hypothetical protein